MSRDVVTGVCEKIAHPDQYPAGILNPAPRVQCWAWYERLCFGGAKKTPISARLTMRWCTTLKLGGRGCSAFHLVTSYEMGDYFAHTGIKCATLCFVGVGYATYCSSGCGMCMRDVVHGITPSSRSLVLQIEICALSRVTAVFLIFAYRNPCIIKGYGVVSQFCKA